MIDVAATTFDNRSHLDSRRPIGGELFTAAIYTGPSHLPRVLISRRSRDGDSIVYQRDRTVYEEIIAL